MGRFWKVSAVMGTSARKRSAWKWSVLMFFAMFRHKCREFEEQLEKFRQILLFINRQHNFEKKSLFCLNLELWRQFGYQRRQRFKVQCNGKKSTWKTLQLLSNLSCFWFQWILYTHMRQFLFPPCLIFIEYRTIQRSGCYQNTLFSLKIFFQYNFRNIGPSPYIL